MIKTRSGQLHQQLYRLVAMSDVASLAVEVQQNLLGGKRNRRAGYYLLWGAVPSVQLHAIISNEPTIFDLRDDLPFSAFWLDVPRSTGIFDWRVD